MGGHGLRSRLLLEGQRVLRSLLVGPTAWKRGQECSCRQGSNNCEDRENLESVCLSNTVHGHFKYGFSSRSGHPSSFLQRDGSRFLWAFACNSSARPVQSRCIVACEQREHKIAIWTKGSADHAFVGVRWSTRWVTCSLGKRIGNEVVHVVHGAAAVRRFSGVPIQVMR